MSPLVNPHNRVLFVTTSLSSKSVGGRGKLSLLCCEALKSIFGSNLVVFQTSTYPTYSSSTLSRLFYGYIDGVCADTLSMLAEVICQQKISLVFLDGSNLGGIALFLQDKYPAVKIISFFHNVEARFFLGAFFYYRTLRALGVVIANYFAELYSSRLSDLCICLSRRDSRLTRVLYCSSIPYVVPIALKDLVLPQSSKGKSPFPQSYILFVGGAFYANESGIRWFVRRVTPHIEIPLVIVGQGMESLRSEFSSFHNVFVMGLVEDLAEWYESASFVVAPIFDGSGMKTKVAEALMFGKTVLASPEALIGYEYTSGSFVVCCSTAQHFINEIRRLTVTPPLLSNPSARQAYEKHYSISSFKHGIASCISRLPS